MIACAISGLSLALHLFLHGAIAGRYVRNVHWRRLSGFLCLAVAALFIPASLAVYTLRWLMPSTTASIDALLPFSVYPTSASSVRKRRDSDAEEEEDEGAELAAEIAAFDTLARAHGYIIARVARHLQEPSMADNILTGFLTALWHCALSGPGTVLVFDTALTGSPRWVFNSLCALAGLLAAGASLHTLSQCGFRVDAPPTARPVSAGAAAAAKGQQRVSAPPRRARTSTLSLIGGPLLLHGLLALAFLGLHVDRGGQVHWSPFD